MYHGNWLKDILYFLYEYYKESVISLGEILADMVGEIVDGTLMFKSFCGASFNVAVNSKNAGASVGFIGRVGKDVIGRFVTDEAKRQI